LRKSCKGGEKWLRTGKVMTWKLQSMSGRGNCYDNAVAESFFHTLKVEQLHCFRFISRNSAKRAVFEFIEMFYNRKRLHSYLNYSSPEQFEKSYYYERFGKCA